MPAVDRGRMEVGMPGEQPWSWYQLWGDGLLPCEDVAAWGELWHEDARIVVPYPAEYHDYFDPRRFQVVVDALASSRT